MVRNFSWMGGGHSVELALPCAFFLGFAVSCSQVNHQVGEGSF